MPRGWRGALGHFLVMLRFFSRLPVPVPAWEREPHAAPDFSQGWWTVPLAGAVIGAIGAMAAWLALAVGLSPLPAAIATIATLCIVTGCLHEDGLADCCDGFFCGATPERRREIMKDSRLGTFGAAGLMLSLMLRVAALAELLRVAGADGLWLIVPIAMVSRMLALLPWLHLPPAAEGGMARALKPPAEIGYGLVFIVPLVVLAATFAPRELRSGLYAGIGLALLATFLVIRLARTKIGGHTGDVLGAVQQLVEMAMLLGLAAAAGRH